MIFSCSLGFLCQVSRNLETIFFNSFIICNVVRDGLKLRRATHNNHSSRVSSGIVISHPGHCVLPLWSRWPPPPHHSLEAQGGQCHCRESKVHHHFGNLQRWERTARNKEHVENPGAESARWRSGGVCGVYGAKWGHQPIPAAWRHLWGSLDRAW